MNKQHCAECGVLISYGLRYEDMIFCNDECADRFGIDPCECFFGDAPDTTDCKGFFCGSDGYLS